MTFNSVEKHRFIVLNVKLQLKRKLSKHFVDFKSAIYYFCFEHHY